MLPFAANNLPGSLVVVVNDFVVVLVPGKGILVGVFAKVRVAFIDEGIFNGSTFIGGNVKGTGAGGTARLPGKVFPLFLLVNGTVPVPDFTFLIVAVVIVDVFVDALLVILSFSLRGFMSDMLLLVLFLNLLK